MTGELLKKRKIAVLGSRSVGVYNYSYSSAERPSFSLSLTSPSFVGKSSLVIQFTENHFVESYYPTIESVFNKTVNYKGVDYDCDIIDTAGQVRIRPRPRLLFPALASRTHVSPPRVPPSRTSTRS